MPRLSLKGKAIEVAAALSNLTLQVFRIGRRLYPLAKTLIEFWIFWVVITRVNSLETKNMEKGSKICIEVIKDE